jgi:mono/diheme cytochrome c family protein
MNKLITQLLILFAMAVLLLTACGNVHIPEVTPADRQARMAEAESMIMPNGYVVGEKVSGQQLYTSECEACHGMKGRNENFGDRNAPVYIGTSATSDPIAFFEITNFGDSERKMPGYYDEMTLEQIADTLAYAQTLPEK